MTDYTDQAHPRRQYGDVPESTGGDRSIGEALGDVTRDLSVLVQQELALAKAEVRQTASRAGQTAGMFAGAAVAAFLFVLFLVARAQMKKISGLPQTTETVRQVPNALKGHEERNV